MGALIRRLWAEFFIGARVSDAELLQLTGLQAHHIAQLATQLQDAQPAAIEYSNNRRMWRLRYTLPAACCVRCAHPRG